MSKGGLDAVKLGGGWRVLVTVVKGKELFRMFVSIHESCHILMGCLVFSGSQPLYLQYMLFCSRVAVRREAVAVRFIV